MKVFLKLIVFTIFINNLFGAKVELPNYHSKIYTIKKSNNPKVLIVAGIHGDEYGGFLSAVYLLKNLKIKNGEIDIIPFLNIKSIASNHRYMIGGGGDMNDKFVFSNYNKLNVPKEYFEKIKDIKNKILNIKPNLLLSLHAGWGYSYKNNRRWGNSIVIDEKKYKGLKLYQKAKSVIKNINKNNPNRFIPYKLKVLNTFSKNIHIDMNDFSSWALKNGIEIFSIESSKNLRIRTQIYNSSFVVLEFLKLYGIKVENRDKILSIKNIKAFLNSLKKENVIFKTEINGKQNVLSCKYKEKKSVKVKKEDTIKINNIELDEIGYFIVPKSEKNYKEYYTFKKYIDFKIKYFDINKKGYRNFCFIKFKVEK